MTHSSRFEDIVQSLPDSLSIEIRTSTNLSKFNNNNTCGNTVEAFDHLLDTVKYIINVIKKLIINDFEYFKPFVRGSDIDNILNIISEIIDDANTLQSLNLKCCRYDNDCKRKECCAYIHYLDFDQIIKPLKYLEDNTLKFVEDNYYSNSSAMIRNIYFIHTALWNSLSRRTFGKCVILGMVKK